MAMDEGGGIIQRLRVLWDKTAAARLEAEAREGARKVGRAMEDQMEPSGRRAAAAQMRGLQREYQNKMASLREQFHKGLINQRQLEQKGAQAGRAFNAGVLRQIDILRAKGELTDKTYRRLTATLVDTGTTGGRAMSALVGVATKLGLALSAAMAVQWIKRSTVGMYELGSAAEETGDKFAITFGAMAERVDAFNTTFGALLGLSQMEAREMTATSGAIVQGMGASTEASAEFSERMVRLAGDLQSFHNVPIADTFAAIRSGLVGAWEPMDRFGIVLRQNDVDLRAMQMTGKRSAAQLTQLEKSQAALTLMYERAGPALDNARITQDSTANSMRRAQAVMRTMREEMAKRLMPIFSQFTKILAANSGTFNILGTVVTWTLRIAFTPLIATLSVLTAAFAGLVAIVLAVAEVYEAWQRQFGSAEDLKRAEAMSDRVRKVGKDAMNTAVQLKDLALITAGLKSGPTMVPGGAPVIVPTDTTGTDTGLGTPDEAAKKTADRIELIRRMRAMGMDASKQMAEAEAELRARLMDGNLALKDRVTAMEQLKELTDIGKDDSMAKRIALLGRMQGVGYNVIDGLKILEAELKVKLQDTNLTLEDQLGLMEQLGQVRQMMGKDTADAASTMQFAFRDAFEGIVGGTKTVGQAMGMLKDGALELDNIMSLVGKDAWKQIVENIKREAKVKAMEAGTEALMETGKGIGRLAVLDFAGAGTHFKAAGVFALAALKWAGIAGGAAAVGGAGSQGGGGRATQAEDPGAWDAENADRKRADFHLTVSGVDPDNPAHMKVVGAAAQNWAELEGGTLYYNGQAMGAVGPAGGR